MPYRQLAAIALLLCLAGSSAAQESSSDGTGTGASDPEKVEKPQGTRHVFRLRHNRDAAATESRPAAPRPESKATMTIVGRSGGKIQIFGPDGDVEVIREHALPEIERSPDAGPVSADPDAAEVPRDADAAAPPPRRRLRQELEQTENGARRGAHPEHTPPPPPRRSRGPR